MSELGTKYLSQCKENYYGDIRPSNKRSHQEAGYKTLVEIAKDYFVRGEINNFISFFQEYQYCVNLWTAHLIIEFGNPNKKIKQEALEIIKRYSETPLNLELAKEEKNWLLEYESKMKDDT